MSLPPSSPVAAPVPAVNPSRLEALFDELCDLPAAEAEARLEAACGDDARLRAAVAELLDHDRAAGDSFLASRAALSMGGLADAAREAGPTEDEAPRARLGRYAVEGKLGQGGMGVVYVGYDERLDRRVALKLLQRNIHLPHRWLLREGQALARLAHPNVVAVYDIGEEDDRVFLAMELVEGPTLRTWLSERPRAAMDVIRVYLQAAYGLAAAHEAGIIHRDFKPDNVLIGRDGRPRVMDFGIAALSEASASIDSPAGSLVGDLAALPHAAQRSAVSVLNSGIIGTPDYMAPEVLRGERATAESDQWAFCMALYRAVYQVPPSPVPASGRRGGASGPAAGPRELVVPSRAGVPGWLHFILARGLSVDRNDRYPSMQALIDALEREVPTDPQMDPRRVSRERRDFGLAFLVSTALQGLPVLVPSMRPWATRPAVLAECAAATTLLISVTVFVHWQIISSTRYGMRLRGLFPITVGAQLFHRLLALRMGTAAEQILTEDLFLWTMCFATTGVLLEPFVLVLAGGVATILVLVAFNLLSVYLAWGGAALCIVVSMAVRLWIDRDLAPSPRSPGPGAGRV